MVVSMTTFCILIKIRNTILGEGQAAVYVVIYHLFQELEPVGQMCRLEHNRAKP